MRLLLLLSVFQTQQVPDQPKIVPATTAQEVQIKSAVIEKKVDRLVKAVKRRGFKHVKKISK